MNVRLTALIGLLFGMLFGTAVLADDAADCAGSDAAKIVSDCTRMIQRPGAAPKTVADAYGKLTGEPGVCMVTRGPGATNASIAVHHAQQDSTPLINLG